MKPKVLTAKEAAALVHDGDTIIAATIGSTGHAEQVIAELENSFHSTGHPCDLFFAHAAGSSDRKSHGCIHFCNEGMTKRYLAAHWGGIKRWSDLIIDDKVEIYNFSQGTIAQLFRAMANGQPGHITKTGLGTYIDPRQEGGKMNERTRRQGEDMVELIHINGEEYLLYKSFPVNIVLIRGTYADEYGNVSMEEEPVKLENMAVVLAGKRWGARVIVQVKRIVKGGSLSPMDIVVPGVFVDYIVECDNWFDDHKQTTLQYFEPAYLGKLRMPEDKLPGIPVPMSIRKVIGRRAAMEARKGDICNVGFGIPYDNISRIFYEEGIRKDIVFTVETGLYGGIPPHSVDFGAAYNYDAMIDQLTQFDYYNGCGVDIAFMGAGEVDGYGNANASSMGTLVTGCGGFIDITQYAKRLILCMTFTTGGLEVEYGDFGVRIIKEGSTKKFVKKLHQVTYNADLARERGASLTIVTDRAVFERTDTGIKLIEMAKGIDLQKDIMGQMDFIPEIAENIRYTDPVIYRDGLMGLKEKLCCTE